jgi:thioesterase domain-containing protein
MIEENPELVQAESWIRPDSWSGKTPVFLIHDGGGTTFAYHCLESLHRFTYALRNPNFFNEHKFEGGLPEMGRLYASWIREAVRDVDFPAKRQGPNQQQQPVDILLGGWSLGGLLSLEVAKQLINDTDIRVKGIVMIDSVYPGDISGRKRWESKPLIEEGKSRNQILSGRAMREARRMVGEWTVPTWDSKDLDSRPPMVMMRAKERVPTDNDSQHSGLDVNRAHKMLGWDEYDAELFTDVIDIDGHHFDIFENDRIPGTTASLIKALAKLDLAAGTAWP